MSNRTETYALGIDCAVLNIAIASYKPVSNNLCLCSKTFSLNVSFCTTAHLPP
ncbi:hypothetical protein [Phormidium nigroviride]